MSAAASMCILGTLLKEGFLFSTTCSNKHPINKVSNVLSINGHDLSINSNE